jgi:hypothetical protein
LHLKDLRFCVSGLESTVAGISVSVDSKGVKKSENRETLQASGEEEGPEWGGRMDQSAGRRLAEVLATRLMV